MRVVGVANRRGEAAVRAYADVGVEASRVEGRPAIENVLASGGCVATEDAIGLATADGVDVVVELTGSIEYSANVLLAGIGAGKHIVQMNAELEGTLGPTLKVKRSEEHTSELQSLMSNSDAVFCLEKKKTNQYNNYKKQVDKMMIMKREKSKIDTNTTLRDTEVLTSFCRVGNELECNRSKYEQQNYIHNTIVRYKHRVGRST